jgi:hypothetical protein
MNETDAPQERISQRLLLRELIEKLSAGSWEDSEIESATNRLELAMNDPDTYLSENPTDAWIIEYSDYNRAEYSYSLQIMTFVDIFAPLSAFGDKADEIAERVEDLFDDFVFSIPATTTKQTYAWYDAVMNDAIAQIQPDRGGFGLLYFYEQFGEDLHLIPVYRPDINRILEISDRFGFRISKHFYNSKFTNKPD